MTNAEVRRRWALNPLFFVTEALGVARVSRQQLDGLEKLRQLVTAKIKRMNGDRLTPEEQKVVGKSGISIMSGHGTGKDAFLSWCIIWFLCCFPRALIPCTAPTQHQLRDVLWSEIRKWMRHSAAHHERLGTKTFDGFDIDAHLEWQAERVYWKENQGADWFAIARTCNAKASADEQAETLSGFHEKFMMIAIDEASGVPVPVFRPLEAAMTGEVNFAMLIFNPTRASGFAVGTQGASADPAENDRENWICLRWNAEESELVSQESRDRIAGKYGKDSNAYRIRVLGLPPLSDPDTLIPWDWIMDAVDRDVIALEDDPMVLGVDVARFGDDKSIILPVQGPRIFDIQQFSGIDTEQLAGWVMGAMDSYEPAFTFVDSIGIGAGVADKLRHRTRYNVIDVNVSELPAEEHRFRRLRDELFWRVREGFENRTISIPNDEELIGELGSLRYQMPDGKIVIEGKKEAKARGKKSPNKADAYMITRYFNSSYLRRARNRGKESKKRRMISWRMA